MFMNVKELIKKVESDASFEEFSKENSKSFIAHVFLMSDGDDLRDMQVGYYNPENKKMTSFTVSEDKIDRMAEQDIFQKPGHAVSKLDVSKINKDYDEVKVGVEKLITEKYGVEGSKKIFILQNLEVGQVWNITYLTTKFSTINVKIDSTNMEIISDEEVQLIDMNRSK